jgi:transposase InsO family protein
MLSREQFLLWCDHLGLSHEAREIIEKIRSGNPARRVGGGCENVSGRYPSRKMGVTIQFESHRVELAFVYEMEHSPDVLEYYDQPPAIPLDYQSSVGKRLAVMHTPDYFVIENGAAGWHECKHEDELEKLASKNPNRYFRAPDGSWRCAPGEAHAEKLGLYYRVRSSAEIDWTFQRNIQFLEDYWRFGDGDLVSSNRDTIQAEVAASPGFLLSELFSKIKDFVTRDDVYRLIATGDLFVDLYAASLMQPDKTRVFLHRESAEAYNRVSGSLIHERRPQLVHMVSGTSVNWDGRIWRIANAGEKVVSLLGEGHEITELPQDTFEGLVRDGRIAAGPCQPAMELQDSCLVQAREDALRVANERFDIVRRHLNKEVSQEGRAVPERTLRLWVSKYKQAEHQHGSGYLGLIPRTTQRGNRSSRLPETSRTLLKKFIEEDYETLKQKTRFAAWASLLRACEAQGAKAPSYATFCTAVRHRPVFERTLKRQGHRAAYGRGSFYWQLSPTTPRHGDRPFEIGHIDHTELDVELVCSHTGRTLGRPWMTLLIDAFSRRCLALELSFDPPSHRSCMMILRDCVRRHLRLPQILVIDGGPEFQSIYFEALLARYECTKKTRPPAQARFGSLVERAFGTTNTQFLYNLQGNTQIMRNVRQVTKSVNPRRLAAWTLAELYAGLSKYLVEVYETIEHPALGQSPRAAFRAGFEATGFRSGRLIPYSQDFLVATLPATTRGDAKIAPGRGVKINHIYYWSSCFQDPVLENQRVPVRYDPFDVGTAFAFVQGRWVSCHSEHNVAFQGRSAKELMLASKELLRRRQCHSQNVSITARKLAEFLQSVENDEILLTQRLRDQEAIAMRRGLAPTPAQTTSSETATVSFAPDIIDTNESAEVYGEF